MLILKIVGISKMIFLSNLTKEYCSVVCSKIVDSSRENLYDHIYSGESTELFKFRKVSVEEQRKGNCITLQYLNTVGQCIQNSGGCRQGG